MNVLWQKSDVVTWVSFESPLKKKREVILSVFYNNNITAFCRTKYFQTRTAFSSLSTQWCWPNPNVFAGQQLHTWKCLFVCVCECFQCFFWKHCSLFPSVTGPVEDQHPPRVFFTSIREFLHRVSRNSLWRVTLGETVRGTTCKTWDSMLPF